MNISQNTQQVLDALRAADPKTKFDATPGKRFDRLVRWFGQQRMVLAFVERETGDIHYSASWKAPAQWSDGPAVEFHKGEYPQYARFVADGGWGYKGDRRRWEISHPKYVWPEDETLAPLPERFDIKALAQQVDDARRLATYGAPTSIARLGVLRQVWQALTGTVDPAVQDEEVVKVLGRTAHVAYTSDLT